MGNLNSAHVMVIDDFVEIEPRTIPSMDYAFSQSEFIATFRNANSEVEVVGWEMNVNRHVLPSHSHV